MKPAPEDIKKACPNVDEALIEQHLARLDDRYFESFEENQIARHIEGLSRLAADHPVELLIDFREERAVECTVLAFDYPAEFSLITGVLAALGLDVEAGDVFTYARAPQPPKRRTRWPRSRSRALQDPMRRRRIIDRFSGRLAVADAPEAWSEKLRRHMTDAISMLERGDQASLTQAKQDINEMVAARLGELRIDSYAVLYPVHIEVDNESADATCMRVVSEDTPFFLYALSTALSLHDVSIERVSIRTVARRIEDEFYFVDAQGRKIVDRDSLNQVKLSVLLTKQFTYFLCKAPDPYAALCRFEQLVGDILKLPQQGRWFDLLSNPRILQDLARLLGASDFLWEDFIRLQYETLLPMLGPHVGGKRFAEPVDTLAVRLENALAGAKDFEERARRLNDFKDREIFLVDLDHILTPGSGFRELSEHLTNLAEEVIDAAFRLTYEKLTQQLGRPRTVAGLEAKYALLGLGKLGGMALGYASDLELLLVYSDSGRTGGPESTDNRDFFERLVKHSSRLIRAKREGIFQVDLRLRPFGQDGPLACSLESFCQYYGKGGQAHSYERLALVRLRALGGDAALGQRVERLRDEMIYASQSIDLAEIRELREKQLRELTEAGRLNAKFSPGALVDLEYTVQILQVIHGQKHVNLRTPSIHQALEGLAEAGVLDVKEGRQLVEAYHFLRQLINGLRMLRGHAKDLFLPPVDADEFAHLARRMGYEPGEDLTPPQQLHLEFETRTATVRAFVERHLGRDSLPGPAVGNVADLVLSDGVPEGLRKTILEGAGFRNPQRAQVNLKKLAGEGERRDLFARLAVLACDTLKRKPDPDMALNNWERFCASLDNVQAHFEALLSQPMRLELLLNLFAGSQFLADTLVRDPQFLDWVTSPDKVRHPPGREELEAELRVISRGATDHTDWLDAIRRFRRRELLRIGARDMCLNAPTSRVMAELSRLAESIVNVTLQRVWLRLGEAGVVADAYAMPDRFCVLAFGKLGGAELNYSSDIDLIGLYDGANREPDEENFARVMEGLRSDLSAHSKEGHAYRVDLRLRPYGRAGRLVRSLDSLIAYYEKEAALWEIQALLKLRPVAGNLSLGETFLDRVRPVVTRARSREEVVASLLKMRRTAEDAVETGPKFVADVKTGPGGLRDIEFLVQGLQLLYGREQASVLGVNTLQAIRDLSAADLLPVETGRELSEDYVFLRRVEHCLQIFEDRQIHAVPAGQEDLESLAQRILGVGATAERLLEELKAGMARVRGAFERYLLENGTWRGDSSSRPQSGF